MTTPRRQPPADDRADALPRGSTIDRYVVLGLVGRGGMGEVYAAYDPELDRKIAVKLLRRQRTGLDGAEGRLRLLREAQAIARLSHPNVVVVFDVGTFGDNVFIAMEFVEGTTLGYWLHAADRAMPEVLRVFCEAGRGLAAAHRAGLIHRDFKPDNVMVGRDGQVRVMDFGLARQVFSRGADEPPAPAQPSRAADPEVTKVLPQPASSSADEGLGLPPEIARGSSTPAGAQLSLHASSSAALAAHLTQTGALLGTPAYMAPEQFTGDPTDARTDQFSFCVALYEGLYGRRPFDSDSFATLMANVVNGRITPAPAGSRVPPRIRQAVLRGLSPSPQDRFPSMEALIAALESDPRAKVRRRVVIAAAILPVAALLIGAGQTIRARGAVCGGGPERLAGIWEAGQPRSARKQGIERAFLATGKSFAGDAFDGVRRVLDAYVADWAAMYRETCEATQIRGEQSAEVLDLRMECLAERLTGLKALTDVFAQANAAIVENAVAAASALGRLDRCADVGLLRAVVKPPEQPAVKARVAQLRLDIARIKATTDAGECAAAVGRLPGLVATAREVGYLPLLAEALHVAGTSRMHCGDNDGAVQSWKEAAWVATAARHDEVAAEASTVLVGTIGYLRGHPQQAADWIGFARATIQRLGGSRRLEGWLENDEGATELGQGRLAEAVPHFQRAAELKEAALGKDHPDLARTLTGLAITLNDLDRPAEALPFSARALAISEGALGTRHPQTAVVYANHGEILNKLGRTADARASFERARQIWDGGRSDEFLLAFPLTGIGLAFLSEGRPDQARAPLERAWAIREAKDQDPARLAEVRFGLARALWPSHKDRARAVSLALSAQKAYENLPGLRRRADEVRAWLARRHATGD